ncbi:MAG: HlyC/CorC family transporter [Anaerolineales bacterium]|nr:HlyC/CorC family transporter [Anaerolineales bacterium]
MIVEILVIIILIGLNGVFATAELAVVQARKVRLQQMADTGDRGARTALRLSEDPNRFLGTIQIGITLIGILSGVFGGATVAEHLAALLASSRALAPYSSPLSVIIVVVVITYLTLVMGEMVPKRVALANAERIATALARPMHALSVIVSPLVRFLGFSTDLILRVLHIKVSTEPNITQEEIEVLIEQGTQSGALVEAEQDLLESVLRLDEWRVGVFMTVRPDIVWIEIDDPPAVIAEKLEHSAHTRFPVSRGELDHILGVVHARDMLAQNLAGQPFDLKPLIRPPLFVPESMPALRLLELFKLQGTHVAMVINEYGAIEGMITDNDILESIVGELPGVEEPDEPDIIARGDGSYLLDGQLHIERFKELFDLAELPDENVAYETLGGFVMYRIGSIPTSGASFECLGLRLEVVDMDGRRVDKVLVTPIRDITALDTGECAVAVGPITAS